MRPHSSVAPYGAWSSPITADLIGNEQVHLDQLRLVGMDIYWAELRPAEGGRTVVVRHHRDGRTTDAIPPGFSSRTAVHEYGGCGWAAVEDTVWFSNSADHRVYRYDEGSTPRPVTPADRCRYADLTLDPNLPRLYAIREDHTTSDLLAINSLVALSTDGIDPPRVLASGRDFYSAPRPSPDGQELAWLEWDHPNMPWDGTELMLARVDDKGSLGNPRTIAGGLSESVVQPCWSPDGVLHFLTDRSGWWNPHRWNGETSTPVVSMAGEFCYPPWLFGLTSWGFESEEVLVGAVSQRGQDRLVRVDSRRGSVEFVPTRFTDIWNVGVDASRLIVIGGSPTEPVSVARIDSRTGAAEILRRSVEIELDPRYISRPQSIGFPTTNDLVAAGLYYPPQNPGFSAPPDEKPPLLVGVHAGPTGTYSTVLDLETQYYTSRGFAVLHVNYRGSSGYGRPYRERLYGQWGVADVDDTVSGAQYLVREGLVDGGRLAVEGESAGGYTTLCALAFRDEFRAGISRFGVSDLLALGKETHKFESHYLEHLVGLLPEAEAVYRERSPINFVDRFQCPLLLIQGLEDPIVPPAQSLRIFESLRARGLPVAYLTFPGEGHGFRKRENMERVLEATLYFLSRIFGFTPSDRIEPFLIENLPESQSPG